MIKPVTVLIFVVLTCIPAARSRISEGIITLGLSLSREPATTPQAGLSSDIITGLNFWLETLNGTSKQIRGQQYRFEIKLLEDYGNASKVTENYVRLLNDTDVDYLLGPLNAGFNNLIVPLTEERNRLILGHTAGSSVFARNRNFAFATVTPAERYEVCIV